MIKNIFSKILTSALIIVMILSSIPYMTTIAAPQNNTEKNSSQVEYKFDFGDNTTEVNEFTKIRATTSYSKEIGYGFNTPENIKNVPASGSGLESDAVQFLTYGTKSTNTFNVDLPNGLYEIKVTLGDTARASIAAESVYQIMNMTGNGAKDSFEIPITDGQLNLLITEGKVGTAFTLSALEIKQISKKPITNKTIYIGGDSTVCNYYPLNNSTQAGWAQMLPLYVKKNSYTVRNMATGGQYARGFRDDGQFEAIMKYIKPGDYFIVQFGINDTNPKNSETESEYKEIMRDMIKQVKNKGAEVILSAPQGRASDFNSENIHSSVNRWYRNSTIALSQEEDIPLIDLNVLSSEYFTSIGKDATLELYMIGDTLHPNRDGANELARLVAADIKRQNLKLSKSINL